MNFAQLYAKVLEKLGESATPQFWSAAELKDYVNRGFREFARQTGSKITKVALMPDGDGRYVVPDNLLKLLSVYYQGKPLEYRSTEYLDSRYAGRGHYAGLRGDSNEYSSDGGDWRSTTGTPECWYFEEGKVCLYPLPASVAAAATGRVIQTGTVGAGLTKFGLTTKITTDENLVDLYLDGVYQNASTYSIADGDSVPDVPASAITNTITLNGTLGIDVPYEIFTHPDPSASNNHQHGSIAAGFDTIALNPAISTDKTRISLYLDGVYQERDTYEVTTANLITLDAPVTTAHSWEVVSYPDSDNYSSTHSGTLTAGTSVITFTTDDYINLTRVDLFLDGVYQHTDQYTATYPVPSTVTPVTYLSTITLSASSGSDRTYTVVAYPSSSQVSGYLTYKRTIYCATGTQYIAIPRGYLMGTNSLRVSIAGEIKPTTAWTEVNPYLICLTEALSTAATVEVTVSVPTTAYDIEARFIQMPADLTYDTELPDLPAAFHDAGWQWACFEALSREGRGRDIEKAALYSTLFAKTVQDWRESFGEKAGPEYPAMPFIV